MSTTIYKEVDRNSYEVYVKDHNNNRPIGRTYRDVAKANRMFAWEIYIYFMPMLKDRDQLSALYDSSVSAGRVLVDAWWHVKDVDTEDAGEFDIVDLIKNLSP